jgi:hypothetical protein
MTTTNRDRNLRVRVDDEDLRMLHAVSERAGVTASEWLRAQILRAYRRFFGSVPPPPKQP